MLIVGQVPPLFHPAPTHVSRSNSDSTSSVEYTLDQDFFYVVCPFWRHNIIFSKAGEKTTLHYRGNLVTLK